MRTSQALSILLALLGLSGPGVAEEDSGRVAAFVKNASEPVFCAEKDNVTITLASPEVRRFRIEAAHPVYWPAITEDRREPDWTGCSFSAAAAAHPPADPVTLYEDDELKLVGRPMPGFWRPSEVPVRVGDRVLQGLGIVQLWVRREGRFEEALVVYPADGYWRARPLAPPGWEMTAYGSSFLVGPVEVEGRPLVKLAEIAFDPDRMRFELAFARGSRATMQLARLDDERLTLEVELTAPVQGEPFAALRSMHVEETNADVARIALANEREASGAEHREMPIMAFGEGRASAVWTGRRVPSRHNTSAPDMTFDRFRAAEAAPEPAIPDVIQGATPEAAPLPAAHAR